MTSTLDVAVTIDVPAPDVSEADITRAAHAAVQAAEQSGGFEPVTGSDLEMTVRLTGDAEIHELNRTYRGVDRPTDVLSFALTEDERLVLPPDLPVQLGDVVVSYPYAVRQAADLEHPVGMEVAWLVIHGTLQLLGYLHDTEEEAERMEAIEDDALRSLGFRKG